MPQPPWCPAHGDMLPPPKPLPVRPWPLDLGTIRALGSGAMGSVLLGKSAYMRVAIKKVPPEYQEAAEREAEVWAVLHHPNVVALVDAFHDQSEGGKVLVMEYAGLPLDSPGCRRPPSLEASRLWACVGVHVNYTALAERVLPARLLAE
ncbi:mrkA [Symbiodinium sp. CCMP2592]|nr:mrkA [Symbiodinium sp. CCMP2592]